MSTLLAKNTVLPQDHEIQINQWQERASSEPEHIVQGIVARLYLNCQDLLRSLIQYLEVDPDARKECRTLRRCLSSLQLWSDGHGVVSGALDVTLDRSKGLRMTTLSILNPMCRVLSQGLKFHATALEMNESTARLCTTATELYGQTRWLLTDHEDYSYESDTDSSSSDGDVVDNKLHDLVNDVTTYTNCLIDLGTALNCPALEPEHEDKPGIVTLEQRTGNDYHTDLIRAKFPDAELCLLESLGRTSWHRYQRMQQTRDLNAHLEPPLPSSDKSQAASSEFQDSGIGTSLPRSGYSASVLSFISSISRGNRPNIPALSNEAKKGMPFECNACGKLIRATNSRDWRKHLYLDLQPYTCLFANCKFTQEPFATRELWVDHFGLGHDFGPSWDSIRCPLCLDATRSGKSAILLHFAKHVEDIALASLPRDVDSDAESDSDIGSEDDEETTSGHEHDEHVDSTKSLFAQKSAAGPMKDSRPESAKPVSQQHGSTQLGVDTLPQTTIDVLTELPSMDISLLGMIDHTELSSSDTHRQYLGATPQDMGPVGPRGSPLSSGYYEFPALNAEAEGHPIVRGSVTKVESNDTWELWNPSPPHRTSVFETEPTFGVEEIERSPAFISKNNEPNDQTGTAAPGPERTYIDNDNLYGARAGYQPSVTPEYQDFVQINALTMPHLPNYGSPHQLHHYPTSNVQQALQAAQSARWRFSKSPDRSKSPFMSNSPLAPVSMSPIDTSATETIMPRDSMLDYSHPGPRDALEEFYPPSSSSQANPHRHYPLVHADQLADVLAPATVDDHDRYIEDARYISDFTPIESWRPEEPFGAMRQSIPQIKGPTASKQQQGDIPPDARGPREWRQPIFMPKPPTRAYPLLPTEASPQVPSIAGQQILPMQGPANPGQQQENVQNMPMLTSPATASQLLPFGNRVPTPQIERTPSPETHFMMRSQSRDLQTRLPDDWAHLLHLRMTEDQPAAEEEFPPSPEVYVDAGTRWLCCECRDGRFRFSGTVRCKTCRHRRCGDCETVEE